MLDKSVGYLLEKMDIPKRLFAYLKNVIFLRKLIESQQYYDKKHSINNKWVMTKYGFSVALRLPNIYEENMGRSSKIYVKSESKIIEYVKLLIKIHFKNEVNQKVIEFYDINDKPVFAVFEIPYQSICFKNEPIIYPYDFIEVCLINEENRKVSMINCFYPTNSDLLNYRYIYHNKCYWNSMLIESEMEEMFCKNPNNIIDKKIFEILCKNNKNSFPYKLIRFLYWVNVSFLRFLKNLYCFFI